jgi:hypothetical protein
MPFDSKSTLRVLKLEINQSHEKSILLSNANTKIQSYHDSQYKYNHAEAIALLKQFKNRKEFA